MRGKIRWAIVLALLINISFVYAHVCSDVLQGGYQYKDGCDPVIITVPSGASQNGNTVSLTINVENRRTPYSPATSCVNPFSSTLTGTRIASMESDPYCSGCFTMNNPGTKNIPINSDMDFNVVVTISGSASPGEYDLTFTFESDWFDPNRYVTIGGISVEGDDCTPDCDGKSCGSDGCDGSCGTCGGDTPICSNYNCVECDDAGDCGDGNACTVDSCSGGVCGHSDLADGSVCGSGHCCDGVCDVTVGNSGFVSGCRSGPSCVGSSWEYSVANNGLLCGGFECRECSNGYCNYDDTTRCDSFETCSSGTCISTGCTSNSNCASPTPYCNVTSHQCVECLQSSNCDDGNACTVDSCSGGVCGHSDLADGSVCGSGHCCDGVCDVTVGNSGFVSGCRSGPSCVGSSWEYSVANNGLLCGGFECRECSNGYCNYDDTTRCSSGETCNSGTCGCVPNCAGKNCGDDGCGGSCGTCASYINGSKCYDSPVCTSGVCGFVMNTLSVAADCCDRVFKLSNSECVEDSVPNSNKCGSETSCSSSCACVENPCSGYDSKDECNAGNDCEWCTLSSKCMDAEEIECTSNSTCYSGGKYCSGCRIDECEGTVLSCGCASGKCTICSSGQTCVNNQCIQLQVQCSPSWTCTDWSNCTAQGKRTRVCTDSNNCNSTADRPSLTESCQYSDPNVVVSQVNVSNPQSNLSVSQKNLSLNMSSPENKKPESQKASLNGGNGIVVWVIIGVVLFVLIMGVVYFFKDKLFALMTPKQRGGNETVSGKIASTNEVDQRLVLLDRWVRYYLDRGIASEYICSYLVGKGWKEADVKNSLRKQGK